jgi:hypothetical protein
MDMLIAFRNTSPAGFSLLIRAFQLDNLVSATKVVTSSSPIMVFKWHVESHQ